MSTSELSGDLKDWLVRLMRQDLDRMQGAGIQSELMNKKQDFFDDLTSGRARITLEDQLP
jgi:hypothetical protein